MEEIFALIISMILIAAVVPLYLWKRRVDGRSREEDAEPPQVILLRNGSELFSSINFDNLSLFCLFDCALIRLKLKVQPRENVIRATGARRMRRRPAASGASSSSSNVQGWYFDSFFVKFS